MAISLLNAWKQVCGESGFDVPTDVVSSFPQMQYIATASVRRLRQYEWNKLRKFGSITLTTATSYTLATDFWSYVPGTLWREGFAEPAALPVGSSDWAMYNAGINGSTVHLRCRFVNDKLEVQNPVDGAVVDYEYISKNAVTDAAGTTPKESFTADTDLCVLDDELFILDLKWRFKKEKGIEDWQIDLQEFSKYAKYRLGVDSGAQTLRPGSGGVFPEPFANLWSA